MNCESCESPCCKKLPVILEKEEYRSLMNLGLKDAQVKKIKESFIYIKPPCPFLKNNKCSIYTQRPIICRIYPVVCMTNNNKLVFGTQDLCPQHKTLSSEEFTQSVLTYLSFTKKHFDQTELDEQAIKINEEYLKEAGHNSNNKIFVRCEIPPELIAIYLLDREE